MNFPTGFAAPFEVWVDGQSLGQLAPGTTVDFLKNGGTRSFKITGITPLVDGDSPTAFPLRSGVLIR